MEAGGAQVAVVYHGSTLLRPALSTLILTLATGAAAQTPPVSAPAKVEAVAAVPEDKSAKRTQLNLLGQTDSDSGESRRNENVQFNLIDNNAMKELKGRLGATATIVTEFRPDQSYLGAEYGDRPAAAFHLAALKAARALHGNLYETHGNSVLSARSFFQVGSVQPAHSNDYGITLDVPLWRGAAMTVGGTQQKIRGSVNGNVLVPTLEERTPLTTDPVLYAIVKRFMAAFPAQLPNRTDINERALNTNSPQSIDTDSVTGQLDQTLGRHDRLGMRYLYTSQVVRAFQFVAGQNPDTTTRSSGARLTWTRAFTPATTLEVSAGFDRLRSLLLSEPHAVGPTVQFGSVLTGLGPGSDLPIDRVQNQFRYSAQFRTVRGSHAWSAGAEFNRRQVNGLESSSNRGVIYFNNDFNRDAITNFRMGVSSRLSWGVGDSHRGFRYNEPQWFFGDHWKAGSRLNVSYSVRYRPVLAPGEVNGLTAIPYDCDCNNIGGHFGLAYRLPDRWGIVRAAYGVFFGDILPVTFQQLRYTTPQFYKVEVQAPDYLADPLHGITFGPGTRTTHFEMMRNLVSPYSHQYNFSWETSAGKHIRLQAGYVGSRTHKILMLWTTNRAVPLPDLVSTTKNIEIRRPDPAFYEVRVVVNGSRAYFDAARFSMLVREWRGVAVDAAYWFSKAIDLGSNYTNTASTDDGRQGRSQNETHVREDLKGLSTFDQSHSFLTRVAWTSPRIQGGWNRVLGRWNLSTVALLKTGVPFDVLTGSDGPSYGNVDGVQGDRPNVLDPSILGRTVGNPDTSTKLLPRTAFSYIAAAGLRGSLGRNVFRRGGIRNVNASVSRSWTLHGEWALTLRAESLNLLNTPQFDKPGNEMASSNFGQITNTLNDGRAIQFTLQIRF